MNLPIAPDGTVDGIEAIPFSLDEAIRSFNKHEYQHLEISNLINHDIEKQTDEVHFISNEAKHICNS